MKKKLNLNVPESAETETVTEVIESSPAVFPNTALSIVHDGDEYKVIEIRFNIKTGDTSVIKELATRSTREEAMEQFKLNVVRVGLFG